jgi:hypothetical protein
MSNIKERRELIIHFLGEQDGEAERELKLAFCRLFAPGNAVQRAYLVQVRYGNEDFMNVVLALIAARESKDDLLAAVQGTFHSMFGIGQHLDILFPSMEQEGEICRVCRPFFGSPKLAL